MTANSQIAARITPPNRLEVEAETAEATNVRILVTGGAGFLGSHLVDRLVGDGHRVDVLDDLSTGRLENLSAAWGRLSFHRGSVLDGRLVDALVGAVDRVVHLASPVGVERVAAAPTETERAITGGGRFVLDAAERHGVPAVVGTSSEVYGFEPPTPVREDHFPDRIGGDAARLSYARAKHSLDVDARGRAAAGSSVLVVRPFNLVGPRQENTGGAVLPRFVARARAGLPLEVHGDGAQRRVFLDARDAARTIAQLIRWPTWPVDAVNLGGREEWSMWDLAHRVVQQLGAPVTVRRVPLPASRGGVEVQRRVPDLCRLEQIVAAGPRFSVDDAILALAEGKPEVATGLVA